MSKYTTRLIDILSSYDLGDFAKASEINALIDRTRILLFDFDYPCSNMTADEKESFEKHFMLHYLTHEIGFETVGLFKIKLQSKLYDIMGTYNELYKTLHFDFDLFNDYKMTTKSHSVNNISGEAITNDKSHSESEMKNETKNGGATLALNSDTPQKAVDIYSNDYVSSINKNIDNTNSDSLTANKTDASGRTKTKTKNDNVGDTETTVFGNNGNNAEKLEKYRRLIINIETDIIKDCRDLFMLVY